MSEMGFIDTEKEMERSLDLYKDLLSHLEVFLKNNKGLKRLELKFLLCVCIAQECLENRTWPGAKKEIQEIIEHFESVKKEGQRAFSYRKEEKHKWGWNIKKLKSFFNR